MTRTQEEKARDEMNLSAERDAVVSTLVDAGILSGQAVNRFIDMGLDRDDFIESLKADPLHRTVLDEDQGIITFDGTAFDTAIFCAGLEERFEQIRNERNKVIFDALGESDVITGEGNRWYVIRDRAGAEVASGYGETGLVHFWDRLEASGQNNDHTWAVMFDDTTRGRISMAAISRDAEQSDGTPLADCHVTGFRNEDSFKRYEADINEFCEAMQLLVYPNHMGCEIEDDTPEP
jgi:hypothetical protein